MTSELTPMLSIIITIISFIFYAGININILRGTNNSVITLTEELKALNIRSYNVEKTNHSNSEAIKILVENQTTINKQMSENNAKTSEEIRSLTKVVNNLCIGIATLNEKHSHLEKVCNG